MSKGCREPVNSMTVGREEILKFKLERLEEQKVCIGNKGRRHIGWKKEIGFFINMRLKGEGGAESKNLYRKMEEWWSRGQR